MTISKKMNYIFKLNVLKLRKNKLSGLYFKKQFLWNVVFLNLLQETQPAIH